MNVGGGPLWRPFRGQSLFTHSFIAEHFKRIMLILNIYIFIFKKIQLIDKKERTIYTNMIKYQVYIYIQICIYRYLYIDIYIQIYIYIDIFIICKVCNYIYTLYSRLDLNVCIFCPREVVQGHGSHKGSQSTKGTDGQRAQWLRVSQPKGVNKI